MVTKIPVQYCCLHINYDLQQFESTFSFVFSLSFCMYMQTLFYHEVNKRQFFTIDYQIVSIFYQLHRYNTRPCNYVYIVKCSLSQIFIKNLVLKYNSKMNLYSQKIKKVLSYRKCLPYKHNYIY